jgi:Protein of unknown function (DUF3631)
MTKKKNDDADRAERLDAVVRKIAALPSTQRILAARDEATAKRHGISIETLQELVDAVIKENEKAERDKARQEKEEAALAKAARRETERKAEQERKEAERIAERYRRVKAAEREKGLAAIARLPVAYHEKQLKGLAKRLKDENENLENLVEALREELATILPEPDFDTGVVPWEEPVSTEEMLDTICVKVRKHVSLKPEQAVTAALWTAFTWNFKNAVHSPYLIAISTDEDSGKSTLLGVLFWMVPNPLKSADPTGPSAYRLVDLFKGTLFVDECDNIFKRKPGLRELFNEAWTKGGAEIWRKERGGMVCFDFWSPKAIGLLADDMLPRTIASRGFNIKMVPPLNNENLTEFKYQDDDEFLVIRRKLLRWVTDYDDAIKAIVPAYPEEFQKHTRPKANWKMPFQIAQHASPEWLKAAHEASMLLGKRAYAPSMGVEGLAAMQVLLKDKPWILSADAVAAMTKDEHSPWNAFVSSGRTRPHPISTNELAALLRKYDTADGDPIQPHAIKAAGNKRLLSGKPVRGRMGTVCRPHCPSGCVVGWWSRTKRRNHNRTKRRNHKFSKTSAPLLPPPNVTTPSTKEKDHELCASPS